MAKITAINIQQKNGSRCNLFVDGEFYSGVSLETVMKFHLKVNMEIDAQQLKELLSENERIEALNKAIFYLSKTLKTKKQVKEYLLKKGYSEEIVWYCIDKLKEYSYIDDKEYSKRFIESTAKNQGQKLSAYKLMMKGVKKQDIEEAYSDLDIDENENARIIAEKYLKNKEINKETLAKAYRYLIGRGFSYDQASYALSKFKEDN